MYDFFRRSAKCLPHTPHQLGRFGCDLPDEDQVLLQALAERGDQLLSGLERARDRVDRLARPPACSAHDVFCSLRRVVYEPPRLSADRKDAERPPVGKRLPVGPCARCPAAAARRLFAARPRPLL